MKTKFLFFISLSILGLTACENTKQAENKLQEEVLNTHDMVMARMDDLNDSQYKLDSLKSRFWNLKNTNPDIDTIALGNTIDSLKEQLTVADDAMMDWMHKFEPDYTGKTHEEIMAYLNDQKVKIDSVKVLFEISLSKTSEIIAKYN